MPVRYRLLNTNSHTGIRLYPGCSFDIVPYRKKNHELYTGLEGLSEKDFKQLEADLLMPNGLGWRSPFWETFFIRFSDDDIVLYPETEAKDRLWDLFLSNHKDCKSASTDIKAMATFARIDEEEEAKVKMEVGEVKQLVMLELSKMSMQDKKDCLRLFGVNGDVVSDNVVSARIFDIADTNPKKFKTVWIDAKNRRTGAFLKRLLEAGVVKRKGRAYFFDELNMGNNETDALLWLDSPGNSQLVVGMTEMLKERK